jgi:hypothetical protein
VRFPAGPTDTETRNEYHLMVGCLGADPAPVPPELEVEEVEEVVDVEEVVAVDVEVSVTDEAGTLPVLVPPNSLEELAADPDPPVPFLGRPTR